MHAGDLLAEMLTRYGVTHACSANLAARRSPLYDGISRRSPRIKHLLVRDERSAAYAADAFGRLTGRPIACGSPEAGALVDCWPVCNAISQ
ncbi:MAG: thiamine pyrophosphate-binding protein [Candidatus Dormibacteraceae bacterium]